MSELPRDRRRTRRRAWVAGGICVTCAGLVSGCGGRQSILDPASRQSYEIELLWWWMLGAAAVVFFGALALLGIAWLRRDTPGLPLLGDREGITEGMVLVFGIAVPVVVLVALFGVANIYLIGKTSAPPAGSTAITIDVIGHQWWWEVRYPGARAITANEIHIPVDTRVDVIATTADVIHSFWVPALNRKVDMVPGMHNHILLDATRVGVYRGQCSQFCGLQHAHMAMEVFVQPLAAFRAWLANMAAPARSPLTALQRAGERVFMSSQCESCHTIAGTTAEGEIGPDLTHVATRTTLAADMIPNNPHELAAWIRDPQAIKPGVRMPDLGLGSPQISELVAYLDSLR